MFKLSLHQTLEPHFQAYYKSTPKTCSISTIFSPRAQRVQKVATRPEESHQPPSRQRVDKRLRRSFATSSLSTLPTYSMKQFSSLILLVLLGLAARQVAATCVDDAEDALDEANDELEAAQEAVSDLEEQLSELDSEIADKESEISSKEDECDSLNDAVGSAEDSLGDAEDLLDDAKDVLADAEEELSEAIEGLSEAEGLYAIVERGYRGP